MTNTTMAGTSTLLMGAPGSGKTDSLHTWLKAGLRLCVVFTEPGGHESLIDACVRTKTPMDKLHWCYVPAAIPSWESMLKSADLIGSMSYKDLSELKMMEKTAYKQWLNLLRALSNFTCDRTGEKLGAVDSWRPDTCFALDSLSGINIMAMDLIAGAKPAKHQGEWGVAMDTEERLLTKLCAATRCFFVLIAHIEREVDELVGSSVTVASALGRKVGPKLPRFFSDTVLAYREGASFYWSTATVNVVTKNRALPLADKMPPSFQPIYDAYLRRVKAAQPTPPAPPTTLVAAVVAAAVTQPK